MKTREEIVDAALDKLANPEPLSPEVEADINRRVGRALQRLGSGPKTLLPPDADIVERLREERGVLNNRWPGPTALELEAAAEIERLRRSLAHISEEVQAK